ncbi:hypothetical protein M422DRAFT_77730, partial [Sphaerobolus stellatus SS14]
RYFEKQVDSFHEVAQIAMFLSVACSIIMGISQRSGDFIVATIFILLKSLAFSNTKEELTPLHADILDQLPRRLATTLSKFNLDGQVTNYAVCPSCHSLYAP